MSDSERAAGFVGAYFERGQQNATRAGAIGGGPPVTPDGKFGMDGYALCGAVLGGLYGALNFGILGAIGGGILGGVLVLVVLGPFWLLHRAWKRRKYGPEGAGPFRPA
jgi:hypothetical protein